jgi:hypothetical protein
VVATSAAPVATAAALTSPETTGANAVAQPGASAQAASVLKAMTEISNSGATGP